MEFQTTLDEHNLTIAQVAAIVLNMGLMLTQYKLITKCPSEETILLAGDTLNYLLGHQSKWFTD